MADGGTDPARSLGLPYDGLKTRQVQGRVSEKKMAKDRGARLHPMSGAGRIKDDASTEDVQYEFKNVMHSHSLRGKDLLALFKRAIRSGKEAVYVVHFDDVDLTATITLTKGRK